MACCFRWVCVCCVVYEPTRNARYCFTRVTRADTTGIEADLDILDDSGNVLLEVRGLQMGTGVFESSERDRVLDERLMTIEWQQRDLPEHADASAGTWLLVSTSATADVVATELAETLKLGGAQCTSIAWPRVCR